jgi:hypothetical protein
MEQVHDPQLRRMWPCLLGIAAGYVTGMLSLTRVYINPTYLIPGLVVVYLRLVDADAPRPLPLPRFNARLVWRLVLYSVATMAAIYVYVRVFARFE